VSGTNRHSLAIMSSAVAFGLMFVVSVSGSASSDRGRQLGAQAIAERVHDQGAKAVVRLLISDRTKWSHVLRSIASGREAWLSVAALLRPGTDGASGLELVMALQEALPSAPADVLGVTSIEGGTETFSVKDACGGYGFGQIEDARATEAIVELVRKRKLAVSKVARASLLERQRSCLRELDLLEKAIANR
jgi:hypothetical protein